jgi:hypothetical protein
MKIAVVCGFVSLAGFALPGCKGTLEALGLPKDMTVVVTGDMAQTQGGDGGEVVHFGGAAPSIEDDITTVGCALVGCHEPAMGSTMSAGNPLNLTPNATGAALDANYMSFMQLTTPADPASSLVIVNATGGGGHTGGQIFTTTTPAGLYDRWVAWIGGGEPE